MTDLVCFKAPAVEAERILKGLMKDYYKPGNPMAIGTPVYEIKGDNALFFCPVFYPLSVMRRVIEPMIIKGFKSSFRKAGITIERVRSNKARVRDYDRIKKDKGL